MAHELPASVLAGIQTPALVIHLDRVRANLSRVIGWMGGDPDRWRPHVKTAKVSAAIEELFRAGIRQFKCATTREAACLLALADRLGHDADVLVAFPLRGPGLERLGQLAAAHPRQRLSVLVEDPEVAASLPASLGAFLDVDPGMHRTGVPVEEQATILDVARRAGPRLAGLHWYEGHIASPDPEARRGAARESYERLLGLLHRLAAAGVRPREVVTSGTPAFRSALDCHPLSGMQGVRHRVSPGTVVYHDARSEEGEPGSGLVPAALVVSRVVSHPGPRLATCDAGSKSLATDAGDPVAVPIGWPGLLARRPSEEHLPFDVLSGPRPERGQALYLVPRHVCPTVNLAEEAILIDGGQVRGVVPVDARAHELRA